MERITAELVKNIAMQIAAFPVEYISLLSTNRLERDICAIIPT
ncbi:hypothetical protein [Coleofasciculus sp.]